MLRFNVALLTLVSSVLTFSCQPKRSIQTSEASSLKVRKQNKDFFVSTDDDGNIILSACRSYLHKQCDGMLDKITSEQFVEKMQRAVEEYVEQLKKTSRPILLSETKKTFQIKEESLNSSIEKLKQNVSDLDGKIRSELHFTRFGRADRKKIKRLKEEKRQFEEKIKEKRQEKRDLTKPVRSDIEDEVHLVSSYIIEIAQSIIDVIQDGSGIYIDLDNGLSEPSLKEEEIELAQHLKDNVTPFNESILYTKIPNFEQVAEHLITQVIYDQFLDLVLEDFDGDQHIIAVKTALKAGILFARATVVCQSKISSELETPAGIKKAYKIPYEQAEVQTHWFDANYPLYPSQACADDNCDSSREASIKVDPSKVCNQWHREFSETQISTMNRIVKNFLPIVAPSYTLLPSKTSIEIETGGIREYFVCIQSENSELIRDAHFSKCESIEKDTDPKLTVLDSEFIYEEALKLEKKKRELKIKNMNENKTQRKLN